MTCQKMLFYKHVVFFDEGKIFDVCATSHLKSCKFWPLFFFQHYIENVYKVKHNKKKIPHSNLAKVCSFLVFASVLPDLHFVFWASFNFDESMKEIKGKQRRQMGRKARFFSSFFWRRKFLKQRRKK